MGVEAFPIRLRRIDGAEPSDPAPALVRAFPQLVQSAGQWGNIDLTYRTPHGAFEGYIDYSDRFGLRQPPVTYFHIAYCNPPEGFGAFCEVAEWMARELGLACEILCGHSAPGVSSLIEDWSQVQATLRAGFEHNRTYWAMAFDWRLPLLPGEALEECVRRLQIHEALG